MTPKWQLELNPINLELRSWANDALQNNSDFGQGKSSLLYPFPYFLPTTAPLVHISFSPQPSTAIKIKDGGHNFR